MKRKALILIPPSLILISVIYLLLTVDFVPPAEIREGFSPAFQNTTK